MDIYASNFTQDLYSFHISLNKFNTHKKLNECFTDIYGQSVIEIKTLEKMLKQTLKNSKKVATVTKEQLRILFQIMYKIILSSGEIHDLLELEKQDSTHPEVVFFADVKFVCAELYQTLDKKFLSK